MDRKTDRQTDRQTETDRQRQRQTDRDRDRQTETERQRHRHRHRTKNKTTVKFENKSKHHDLHSASCYYWFNAAPSYIPKQVVAWTEMLNNGGRKTRRLEYVA